MLHSRASALVASRAAAWHPACGPSALTCSGVTTRGGRDSTWRGTVCPGGAPCTARQAWSEAPKAHEASAQPGDSGQAFPTAEGAGGRDDVVSISYRGHVVSAPRGARLRTALLRAGVTPHNGGAQLLNCRGLGTCGTCAVHIARGTVSPAEWTTAERLRLNFPPHGPPGNARLRLACQVRCIEDVEVVKYDKFWGEGSVPRAALTAPVGGTAATAAGLSEEEQRRRREEFPFGTNTPLGALEYVMDRGGDVRQ